MLYVLPAQRWYHDLRRGIRRPVRLDSLAGLPVTVLCGGKLFPEEVTGVVLAEVLLALCMRGATVVIAGELGPTHPDSRFCALVALHQMPMGGVIHGFPSLAYGAALCSAMNEPVGDDA